MANVIIFTNLIVTAISSIEAAFIFDYSNLEGSDINIEVGKLFSNNYIIPFSYNTLKIWDVKRLEKVEDNLGELLTGEDLYITEYIAKINIVQFYVIKQFIRKDIRRLKD